MARYPDASTNSAMSEVRAAGVPSGISSVAVTKSASTVGMKFTRMMPAGTIATERTMSAIPVVMTSPG